MSRGIEMNAAAKSCPISSILQRWFYINRICTFSKKKIIETCVYRYPPKGWHIRIVLRRSDTYHQRKPQNGQIFETRVYGWIPGSTHIGQTNRLRGMVYSIRPFTTYKKFTMKKSIEKVRDDRRLQPLGGGEVP